GITKFKCATIAEAEMAADSGAPDVMLAGQPVGPNVRRFIALMKRFPATRFSTMADDDAAIRELSRHALAAGVTIDIFLDLDVGQHRTGVAPGARAVELYHLINVLPALHAAGLHGYDGHIHEPDPAARTALCEAAFAPADALRAELERAGMPVPRFVAGGSPTFPIHARRNVECSPGTTVLWDAGYGRKLRDLPFEPAALLLTRVVSKPAENRLCLDLGHKAVAAEMPHPRVIFPVLHDVNPVVHSEEHLVIETPRGPEFAVGDALLGIPWHVCPTVALHSEVWALQNGEATERWPVVARARRITI
ncbi:MAG TPA: D-TA family PLP-dependent enzyme, partial [Chthoniobacteraceae bacterium]|nr:D-TA family PLP-dependent enzyme [Chthoniobacteraceae bacterium]